MPSVVVNCFQNSITDITKFVRCSKTMWLDVEEERNSFKLHAWINSFFHYFQLNSRSLFMMSASISKSICSKRTFCVKSWVNDNGLGAVIADAWWMNSKLQVVPLPPLKFFMTYNLSRSSCWVRLFRFSPASLGSRKRYPGLRIFQMWYWLLPIFVVRHPVSSTMSLIDKIHLIPF